MNTTLFIVAASLLAAGSIGVGVFRNRRFKAKELLHLTLAESLGLELAFASPQQYSIFGHYNSYPVRIEGVNLARPGSKEAAWFTHTSIPMTNPLRKMIRVSKRHSGFEELESLVQVARPDSVSHDLSDELDIQTNDLMFASVILSENVKISLHQLFQQVPAGVLAIEDDSLFMTFPGLMTNEEQQQISSLAVQTLTDIKDELNP